MRKHGLARRDKQTSAQKNSIVNEEDQQEQCVPVHLMHDTVNKHCKGKLLV